MPRLYREQPRDTWNYRTRNELVWNVPTGPLQHRMLFGHGITQQYDENISNRTARSVGGNVRDLETRYELENLIDGVRLNYQGRFIPEFIGRLPVVTTLAELSESQLVSILTDPKNALTKQFAKLLAMEGVEL